MTLTAEGLIGLALKQASNVQARWIGNQSLYNGSDSDPIPFEAKAALYVAVKILSEAHALGDEHNETASDIENLGEARALVRKISALNFPA